MRMREHEPMDEAVRRLVTEQLAEAAEGLAGRDPSETLPHELRRHLKKARALLKLARGAMGPKYRRQNDALREIGQRFSSLRDRQVHVETMRSLLERYSFPAREMALRHLESLAESATAEIDGPLRDWARDECVRAAVRVRELDLAGPEWKIVQKGLKRTYRRGRDAWREARRRGEAEAFHEWRKAAKSLRHQLQAMSTLWRDGLDPIVDDLKALGDVLGEDHDLQTLLEQVDREPAAFGGRPAVLRLRTFIERRQQELRAEAVPLGERLFSESPKAFTRRIKAYWTACRETVRPEATLLRLSA